MSNTRNWKPLMQWPNICNSMSQATVKDVMAFASSTGKLEWRVAGSGHLMIRYDSKDDKPCCLSGTGAENPVYAAKLRTALRRWKSLHQEEAK